MCSTGVTAVAATSTERERLKIIAAEWFYQLTDTFCQLDVINIFNYKSLLRLFTRSRYMNGYISRSLEYVIILTTCQATNQAYISRVKEFQSLGPIYLLVCFP